MLIATKLPAKAERETAKEKMKTLPRVERAGAKLATAFQVVFDTTSEQVDTDTGEISPPKVETLQAMWERIEAVVPRSELAAAIAALLVAHGCNVGYTPVISGSDALKYGRLSHVDQTYLRLATYRTANTTLIATQAAIGLAGAWGGGLVASVDGMQFVVPVPSVYARPNPKSFGRRGGATWLNMINDQAVSLGGKVVAGTPRDSLYVLDVLYDRDGGKRPDMIVTDIASHSDIVFGLLTLVGVHLRATVGGPAGPEDVAHRPRRGLRRVPGRGPRPGRPDPDRAALGGHPADHRLHPYRGRACLRRDPDAVART